MREHETSAEIWVDLNKMNQWRYIDKPELEDEVDKLGVPSGPILHSGTIDNEDYMQFYYNYMVRDEPYYVNWDENR